MGPKQLNYIIVFKNEMRGFLYEMLNFLCKIRLLCCCQFQQMSIKFKNSRSSRQYGV